MQSVSDQLNRLIEEGAWFARAHEVRLLVARLSGDLRKTALQLLLGLECHADNFSPWVLLEDGHTPADDGWQASASRLAALCQGRGLLAPAASLNAQADLMEQGALGREDFDRSVLDDDLSERVTSPYTEGSSMFSPVLDEDPELHVALTDNPDEPEA